MLRCLISEHAKNKDPSIPQIVSSLESRFMHFTGELFDESGCLAQTTQTTQVNGASHPLTFAVSARSPDLLVFIGKLKVRQRSAHHLSFGLGDTKITKHARRDSTHARGYNPTAGGNATHSDSHAHVMNTTTWWPTPPTNMKMYCSPWSIHPTYAHVHQIHRGIQIEKFKLWCLWNWLAGYMCIYIYGIPSSTIKHHKTINTKICWLQKAWGGRPTLESVHLSLALVMAPPHKLLLELGDHHLLLCGFSPSQQRHKNHTEIILGLGMRKAR